MRNIEVDSFAGKSGLSSLWRRSWGLQWGICAHEHGRAAQFTSDKLPSHIVKGADFPLQIEHSDSSAVGCLSLFKIKKHLR